MTAIITRYIGPSNVRAARIVAESCGQRIVVPYDHASDSEGAHAKAALALILRQNWGGRWIMGGTRTGYACVQARESKRAAIISDGRVLCSGSVRIVS